MQLLRPTDRPRRAAPALAALLALLLALPVVGRAQDGDEDELAAESAPIVSTRLGEVPTTGGRRPGPLGEAAAPARRAGVAPIGIEIDATGIAAEIERLAIVEGVMQNPTGPWVVSWYEDLAGLGEGGNVVMAGHVDYWNVGPAVFYALDQLAEGDEIDVTGEDGSVHTYAVEWVRQYDAADAPLEELVGVGGDAGDSLTLITCGGTFDYTNGEYLQRTVVRANRVEP